MQWATMRARATVAAARLVAKAPPHLDDPARFVRIQTLNNAIPAGPGGLLFGWPRRDVAAEDMLVDLGAGHTHRRIRIRIHRPSWPSPVARRLVLHFHGGGWSTGGLNHTGWICSQLAARANAVVVNVDYRMAPLHIFPAATDDCYEVTRWAWQHAAELGARPGPVSVVSDSAGGNLAASVALRARDESDGETTNTAHTPSPHDADRAGHADGETTSTAHTTSPDDADREPARAHDGAHDAAHDGAGQHTLHREPSTAARGFAVEKQALIYPVVDLTLSGDSMCEFAHAAVMTRRDMENYVSLYVPNPAERTDPLASALLAHSHAGLPRALVVTAGRDPLRDDGRRYAAALSSAGVAAQLVEYPEMPHGFTSAPTVFPEARAALRAVAEFLLG